VPLQVVIGSPKNSMGMRLSVFDLILEKQATINYSGKMFKKHLQYRIELMTK